MKIGYGQIIKKSFFVAKRSKWLWIYGILLATSGSSFNTSRWTSSQDFQNLPSSIPQVFGSIERILTTWASQLSAGQISTFFGSLFIFGLFGIIIKFVLDSWALGSMVYGTEEALDGKEATLTNTSPKGLVYFKSVIALKLISFAMAIGLILAILIPTAILVSISVALKAPLISAVVGLIAIFVFVIAVISLAGASIYGVRLIVLKNYTAWNAWKNGLKKGKKYPVKLVIGAVVSSVVSGVISFVAILVSLFVLGLPVFLLISPLFEGKQSFSLAPVIPSVILLFVFIWFNAAVTGAVVTFKTAFWNQFFEKIWNEK